MASVTVLMIRHADKPMDGVGGVDEAGDADAKSLTPRGWQRAGIWAQLFDPSLGQFSALPTPQFIFASAPASHTESATGAGGSKSKRPLETVSPLAAKLAVTVDLRFSKGAEADLAAALSSLDGGVALVSWQHENIVDITAALAPGTAGVPTGWPDDRFNVIFRFDRADGATTWSFSQIVPIMLNGDLAAPI